MSNRIHTSIGKINVSNNTGDIITIHGIGSCIGLTMYDKKKKIGGMAHILVPNKTIPAKEHLPALNPEEAVPNLLKELTKLGARKENIETNIVGGAHLKNLSKLTTKIGEKNILSVKKVLADHEIYICKEDVGGVYARRLSLHIEDGQIHSKTILI